jgi:hypothetical protein
MHWVTIDSQIMLAAAEVSDGDLIRLFVAPQPEGTWDWRVWHTVKGQCHRFGVASTAPDAVVAAEQAAEELSGAFAALAPLDAATGSADATARPPFHSGRVFKLVLGAFHLACDQSDLEVGTALLGILDTLAAKRRLPQAPRGTRIMEQLVAAHARQWHLLNEAQA